MKLAHAFWQAAVDGVPLRGRQVMSPSPLRILYTLYGWVGPLLLVGVSPRERILATSTQDTVMLGGDVLTTGHVETADRHHSFSLIWRPGAERPVASELLPFGYVGRDLPLRSHLPPTVAARLYDEAPRPGVPLDAITAAIFDADLVICGLPLVLRALAARRAAAPCLEDEAIAPQVAAAALTTLVSRSSGLRSQSARVVAGRHVVEPAEVQRVVGILRRALRLQPSVWW